MHFFTLVPPIALMLLLLLLPSSPVVLASGGVRVARQATAVPSAFPDGVTIPVKFAGGIEANRPSVGALISNPVSVSNRNVNGPPIVFGRRPSRFPTRRPFNRWRWGRF